MGRKVRIELPGGANSNGNKSLKEKRKTSFKSTQSVEGKEADKQRRLEKSKKKMEKKREGMEGFDKDGKKVKTKKEKTGDDAEKKVPIKPTYYNHPKELMHKLRKKF